jgi:hypothetical protein
LSPSARRLLTAAYAAGIAAPGPHPAPDSRGESAR